MTWQAIAAVFAALFKALEPYVPALVAIMAGRKWQEADDDAQSLKSIDAATHAASRVDVQPAADVVRDLHERGLYRVSDKPADRG